MQRNENGRPLLAARDVDRVDPKRSGGLMPASSDEQTDASQSKEQEAGGFRNFGGFVNRDVVNEAHVIVVA
jgi:hypothetical protein